MLVISTAQLEVFERIQFDKMMARIQGAIALAFPETCAMPPAPHAEPAPPTPNEYALGVVEKGVEHGVNMGFTEGPDLAAFIALGLALRAGGKPPPPWLSSWLTRPDTPGTTRLAVIEAQLADQAAHDAGLLAISARVEAARRAATL